MSFKETFRKLQDVPVVPYHQPTALNDHELVVIGDQEVFVFDRDATPGNQWTFVWECSSNLLRQGYHLDYCYVDNKTPDNHLRMFVISGRRSNHSNRGLLEINLNTGEERVIAPNIAMQDWPMVVVGKIMYTLHNNGEYAINLETGKVQQLQLLPKEHQIQAHFVKYIQQRNELFIASTFRMSQCGDDMFKFSTYSLDTKTIKSVGQGSIEEGPRDNAAHILDEHENLFIFGGSAPVIDENRGMVWEYVQDIAVFKNGKVHRSTIQCPLGMFSKGAYFQSDILKRVHGHKLLMLTFGFIRNCWKNKKLQHLLLIPDYLMRLVSTFADSFYVIQLFTTYGMEKSHYEIDADIILDSLRPKAFDAQQEVLNKICTKVNCRRKGHDCPIKECKEREFGRFCSNCGESFHCHTCLHLEWLADDHTVEPLRRQEWLCPHCAF